MKCLSQIRKLTIPTHYTTGSVNIYAIKGPEGYYLIDSGIATEAARKLINQWVPRPLAGILLTHGHLDHIGLAGEISLKQGCPVYLYSEEYNRLKDPVLQTIKIGQLLAMGGVPIEQIFEAKEAVQRIRSNIITMLDDANIKEFNLEHKFLTELGDLEVIHTPGHTLGHCCFYLADNKVLFSGDHILSDIFPNPVLEIGKDGRRSLALVDYLNSIKKIATLSIQIFYPGHGKTFDKLDEVLTQFYSNHLKREKVILGNLSQLPQTPFQVTQRIYPGVKGMNIFLAISRVWGYLDLLNLEGKVMVQIKDDITYYYRTDS